MFGNYLYITLCFLQFFALGSSALARSERITADLPEGWALSFDNPRGTLTVEAWDNPSSVEINADLDGEVQDEQHALLDQRKSEAEKRLEFAVRLSGSSSFFSMGKEPSANILVKVPAAASMQLSSISGNIIISNITGALAVKTVSGDIAIDGASNAAGSTVSGDIRTTYTASPSEDQHFKSISGDLKVTLPPASTLKLDLRSISGEFSPEQYEKRVSRPPHRAVFSINKGEKPLLKAETVSGDIAIDCPEAAIEQIGGASSDDLDLDDDDDDDDDEKGKGPGKVSLGIFSGLTGLFPSKIGSRLGYFGDLTLGLTRSHSSQTVLHNAALLTELNSKWEMLGFEMLGWGYSPAKRTYTELLLGLSYFGTNWQGYRKDDRVGLAAGMTFGYQQPLTQWLGVLLRLTSLYSRLDEKNFYLLHSDLGFVLFF